MITIDYTDVVGWEAAISGMRNPMNSWAQSDSAWNDCDEDCATCEICHVGFKCPCGGTGEENEPFFKVGKKDLALMKRLCKAGPDHRKFMRMIAVYADITAPLYWWKEFDTYKVGTVANSCSTMHKIHARPFTIRDFSHEHLEDKYFGCLEDTIRTLNDAREMFLFASKEEKPLVSAKDYWWQMIQLLPTSYNQKRTVMLNYEVLTNIYHARRNHKLDCWRNFCEWIKSLPYSELITGEENVD